ncbi:MAG: hypothetical protein K2N74_05515 [Clostridiales bacterium]|nr:hypothetical protein [Clostridiales bacterium]
MIKIICGPKGSGKTKKLIDAANACVAEAKGHLVFITDTKRYMYDLKREIRFIDVSDYSVAGEEALCGFIKGAIAGSYDNEFVFIDGVARIAGKKISDMPQLFYMLEKVAALRNLKLYITCSCAEEELPDFVKKYL